MNTNENSEQKKKRNAIVIRQMEIDDVPKVFHLGEELFSAKVMPSLYRTWDEFEVVELFRSDSDFCLVADIDQHIIGFALGTTIEKSRSAWKYGHLIWLGVDPKYQRLGVAERLFNRFRDVMMSDGVRMLLVDTEAENLPALHFFRKLGFGNPEEHIYLTLNLATHLQELKKKNGHGPASRQLSKHDE
jgi:ribosomal protein S18 acetylase RimI-like enzyme